MSDPFAPHSTENLEASTAMTTVGDRAMDHVGGEAARLVKAAISTKPQKSARKSKPVSIAPPADAVYAMGDDEPAVPKTTIVETRQDGAVPAQEADLRAETIEEPADEPVVETTPGASLYDGEVAAVTAPLADVAEALGADASIENAVSQVEADPVPAWDPSSLTESMVHASSEALAPPSEPSRVEFEDDPLGIAPVLEEVQAVGTAIAPATDGSPSDVKQHLADRDVMFEFGNKIARTIHVNIDASFVFFVAMLKAKTPTEAMALNTAHICRQMDSFVSSYQDFSALVRKAVVASIDALSH